MVNDGSANRSGSRNQNIADFWKLIKPLILVEKFSRNEGIWSTSEGADFIERYISLLCSLFFENAFAHGDRTKLSQLTLFPRWSQSIPLTAWEQRKFADFITASGIRNSENLDLPSYSVTNDRGFVPQDEQFENGGTMREADKTSYWIVEPNSFAYNPARINVGSIGYQSTGGNVIVSSLYEVFRTDETCDDHFLWHWFKTRLFTQQIEMLQEGGVRLYFFFDKLLKSGISMPSVDEQRLIGEQFDWLDSLITLHQREPGFTDTGYMRVERALMTMSMSLFSSS